MTKTATLEDLFITPDEQRMLEKIQESAALFGHIVKAMREGVSMSVAKLALATGISRKRLEAIERGLPGSKKESDLIARAIAFQITHHATSKKLDLTSKIVWSEMSAEAQSAFVRGVASTFDHEAQS